MDPITYTAAYTVLTLIDTPSLGGIVLCLCVILATLRWMRTP